MYRRQQLLGNLKWGVGYGLIFAVLFSLIVIVQYLLAGPGVAASRGIPVVAAIGAYFGGGIIGGVLLGLLRPLTRWRLGSAVVGIITCLPLSVAFALAFEGRPSNWSVEMVAAGIIVAVLIGGMSGYQWWEAPS